MAGVAAILRHPEDLPALVRMKIASARASRFLPDDPDLAFCYSVLNRVSRSFAFVIQQLGVELRNAVCVFYLVLRGLDTVEDDTSIELDVKVPILKAFHEHIYDPSWKFLCGVGDYKELMEKFHHVINAFLHLGKGYQDAIQDTTKKMGAGMAKFVSKEVETIEDYDEYCHYVAGLVGLGLSRLFHAANLEDASPDSLSNSMGLFLQKTNIIRDYLEDINEIPKPRMFWPREVWGKYASKLEDFKEENKSKEAVQCLNELVTNALKHATDCLKYMSNLRDPAIFRFCAVPQIMAIATLDKCYNNVEVYRGVVKIRKGLTAKIMDSTKTMADVYEAFYGFSRSIASKVPKHDPNAFETLKCVNEIQMACKTSGLFAKRRRFAFDSKRGHEACLAIAVLVLAIILAIVAFKQ